MTTVLWAKCAFLPALLYAFKEQKQSTWFLGVRTKLNIKRNGVDIAIVRANREQKKHSKPNYKKQETAEDGKAGLQSTDTNITKIIKGT